MSKQKLELTWIGKEKRPKLEPRILLEDPEKSYHAKHRVTDNDIFDNRLIFGDNLLALKALEQEFSGKVKCVFIFHRKVKTTGFQPVSFSATMRGWRASAWITDTAVIRSTRSSITLFG
ncbi:hypothetical protein LMG7053_00910 [Achromobacter ruhlandii]|uniref:DNA methylase N-4/N-6 domain-containing protein n=1 Tax=Achromobacter ruhlandii TaxID=72557 RepID=A0ABM8LQZ9_9BURK|nr:hypothetical protein LMG7053_00910 [Achromobacter ruhlandii]